MGFLRRVLRGSGPSGAANGDDAMEALSAMGVERLLAEHGLQALDKQLHLQDLVGEADWLLDQDAGTITFGGEKAFPAQVLGTQSDADGTWRWAWANPSVPAGMTTDAVTMRAHGEHNAIAEFTAPDVVLDGILSGETFAMIASQIAEADAYYRGPFEGGAAFVMVRLPDDAPRQVDGDLLRAVRTLSYAPLALPIGLSHAAVARYLSWLGLVVEVTARRLVGRDAAGRAVTVDFDRRGRMSRVSSTIPGAD